MIEDIATTVYLGLRQALPSRGWVVEHDRVAHISFTKGRCAVTIANPGCGYVDWSVYRSVIYDASRSDTLTGYTGESAPHLGSYRIESNAQLTRVRELDRDGRFVPAFECAPEDLVAELESRSVGLAEAFTA